MAEDPPSKPSWGRDPERIPMILAAIEREWRKEPDLRLGQLVVNLLRENAHPPGQQEGGILFGVSDGALLQWLGPQTEAEEIYIREEPRRAREGWRAWEKAWRESDAYKEWRRTMQRERPPDEPGGSSA